MVKKNINQSSRIIRFSIAVLILAFAIWQKSWIALLFSLFVFFEALMSWCVVYALLGKNECPIEANQKNTQTKDP